MKQVKTKRRRCPSCERLFSPGPTGGRLRTFCSVSCKRKSGYEVTRINRRIEKLEQERDELMGHLNSSTLWGDGLTTQEKLDHVAERIKFYNQRLLKLLTEEEES